MTRAQWYATRYSGGWRKARKRRLCGTSLCMTWTEAGSMYFDTNQKVGIHKTLCICAGCAQGEVK